MFEEGSSRVAKADCEIMSVLRAAAGRVWMRVMTSW